MGPWHLQWRLPLDSLGPIISLAGAINALGWAHGIHNSSCQLIHLGPLFLRQLLSMPLGGPIAFTIAAAASFAWAHTFFSRCCRCPQMGPWHLQWQLPIDLFGPMDYSIIMTCLLWQISKTTSFLHIIALPEVSCKPRQ